MFGAEAVGTVPRNGQVLIGCYDGDIGQVGSGSIAERVDVAEVDTFCVAIDDFESGELLDQCIAAGHSAGRIREQEVQLLVRELTDDVQDFSEEATLDLLSSGFWVLDGLCDATHVGNAIPAGSNYGSNFSLESA